MLMRSVDGLPGLWAVVVARLAGGAKSRLAPALGPHQRRRLALAMLIDVLDACATAGLDGTLVVLDTPAAQALAEQHGAQVVLEPPSGLGDMNAAVTLGIEWAMARGASSVVALPADVPLLSRADLHQLLECAGSATRAVIIGASHDGCGTNALLLRPPDVIAPSFGPPSVGRHLEAARAAGAQAVVCQHLDLALDIDTPADLHTLQARTPANCTGAVLRELQITSPPKKTSLRTKTSPNL